MNMIKRSLSLLLLTVVVMAQSSDPPLGNTRLTVHTLLREDIFAGFLANDMQRFERGERNIQLLMQQRPAAKSNLLAWQGLANLYRAVRAYEGKSEGEFQNRYESAVNLFAEARKLGPNDGGVAAVTGGSYVVLADRLPKEKRAAAWSQAYDAYQMLWAQQGSVVDKLPVHIRGELLAGLAQSAQRTGRTEEAAKHVDKILEVLRDTPYEGAARQWKKDPNSAGTSTLACMTCHEPGRLVARLADLNGK
jgi:tetratricopeptide (TPR) repeat protein